MIRIIKKSNHDLFFDRIRKGIFFIPYCKYCKKNFWPITDFCSKCFNKIVLKNYTHKKGILLESFESYIDEKIKPVKLNTDKKSQTNTSHKSENTTLGLVDFDGVILLGKIVNFNKNSNNNEISYIRINKCGIDSDNKIFYEFYIL